SLDRLVRGVHEHPRMTVECHAQGDSRPQPPENLLDHVVVDLPPLLSVTVPTQVHRKERLGPAIESLDPLVGPFADQEVQNLIGVLDRRSGFRRSLGSELDAGADNRQTTSSHQTVFLRRGGGGGGGGGGVGAGSAGVSSPIRTAMSGMQTTPPLASFDFPRGSRSLRTFAFAGFAFGRTAPRFLVRRRFAMTPSPFHF